MKEQEKVLRLYEKVSNLVAFRFAELVNEATNQGYYSKNIDTLKDWENKLYTAFDRLL